SGTFYVESGNGSGAQNVIEFDPPVSSVSFYYSRLQGERAWWGGVIVEHTDSMMVYARSRIPGTTFYNDWASRKLYSNVPSTTVPWSVWTPVTLSTSGDKIQWLWFDGNLVLDNLQITRKPLSCTGAQRGQVARCELSSAAWTVTGWEFQPDSGFSVPAIQDTSSSRVWQGTAAVPGMVTVHVTNGSTPTLFRAHLGVTDRSYNWSAQWSYRQGPELTVADAEVASSNAAFGRNCLEEFPDEATCTAVANRSRLQPDPNLEPDSGFTVARVASGPNRSYWYVSSIQYRMKRVGNVHPGMLVTSLRKHPVPPAALTTACKKGIGVKHNATAADANMNQFNQFCGPLGTDMTIFVPAIWGHEGFGYNGGVGHETLGQQAAGEPQNDPYKAIESVVRADSAILASNALIMIQSIGDDITEKSADGNAINGGPHGNYAPAAYGTEMWFWEIVSGGGFGWSRRPLTSNY
ncbi:MAG TPA: hypothetical protein VLK82_10305, partial [Candidatus Tectomicrobia bacterium]|nr:hypothetical protein [Candidatus Tectomicrobia bacterium]